jgi:hypothetical protein
MNVNWKKKKTNSLQTWHTDNFKHQHEMYGFNIIIHQHVLHRRQNQSVCQTSKTPCYFKSKEPISLPNIKDTLLLQKQTPQNKELVEWYSWCHNWGSVSSSNHHDGSCYHNGTGKLQVPTILYKSGGFWKGNEKPKWHLMNSEAWYELRNNLYKNTLDTFAHM